MIIIRSMYVGTVADQSGEDHLDRMEKYRILRKIFKYVHEVE
jgi:hypothetical protein